MSKGFHQWLESVEFVDEAGAVLNEEPSPPLYVLHYPPDANITDNYDFPTDDAKLRGFMQWLKDQVDRGILTTDEGMEKLPWCSKYIGSAYKKGMIRAYLDSHKKELGKSPDYYKGTQAQFLESSFDTPETVDKLRLLYTRSYEQLKGVTATMAQQMSRVLATGIVQGQHPMAVARTLANTITGISRQRARTISRTEIMHAHAEGQLDGFEDMGIQRLGVDIEFETIAGEDGDPDTFGVCPECAELQGEVFTVAEARGIIPVHPNCVVGETRVYSPSLLAIMRSHYTGEIVQIQTANGRFFSVTKNHILLTQRGWVRACNITNGDQLVDASRTYGCISGGPNNDKAIARVEDVFTSLQKSLERGAAFETMVVSSPEYLHGDGKSIQGKIHIIRPNGLLGRDGNLRVFCKPEKSPFVLGDISVEDSAFLDCNGSLSSFLIATAAASDSLMGFGEVSSVFLRGSFSHHPPVGDQAVADWYSGQGESIIDDVAGQTEGVREMLTRNPGFIEIDDLLKYLGGNLDPRMRSNFRQAPHNTKAMELLTEAVGVALKYQCDGIGGRPVLVHFGGIVYDPVITASLSHVSDLLVYDVETKESVYLIDGVVSSNCRCSWGPVVGDMPDEEEQE
jgi:hypothetical protein